GAAGGAGRGRARGGRADRATAGGEVMATSSRVGAALAIQGYASLWGVADLNGDVTARGVFADSLAKTGAGGVRMLHQHESRAVVGVWNRIVEDERGLW